MPQWFTYTPAEFGKRHYPEDPSYQLMTEEEGGAVTWEAYITAAPGPQITSTFDEENFHRDFIQPYSSSVAGGQYHQFRLSKYCEHMSIADSDNYCLLMYFGDTREPLYPSTEGAWTANVYVPPDVGTVTLCIVSTLDGEDAKGLSPHQWDSVNGRRTISFSFLARWNVV
ncbi:hypothetical protein M422DRAFT_273457 [Sphaerobolus stellatus SS14]|uniref:Uncharacterized protein n=1 Tax=Sphaerobolus stellatus (strain SS14) TaxID=990650 RepID=A0A0C9T938_SPHS4|nr:hypothetical protein M422DRAFT_273457 [Sphaerobolus stellatus SS14]